MNTQFPVLTILLPLLGFIINILIGKSLPKFLSGLVGYGTVLVSFCLAVYGFMQLTSGGEKMIFQTTYEWFSAGGLHVNFSFLLDHLSILMVLIITGIGFLIHVYSVGYMHDDEDFARFFAYMNLFVFFMLILVMASNYIVMFVGWEGVGLCSYLLIGFWFKNQEYNNAAKKAFIMNRIGDLGFIIGIFLIYNTFHSLNFDDVFSGAANFNIGDPTITAITMLLFVGAIGKSAQIPLYTWLPDAMAGPTPVSALIHAATMVTAGIYLIVRSHVLYALSPMTLDIVAITGLVTSIFAGTIGLAQNDIKKVLAYSTVSQLGFMFLALGVGAYSTAMFHLTTHAFFKALLFLGAGSVIHAMGGEQDIRRMGGLRKKLPITFIIFLVGTLAITGIPPFAGFFSKDEILSKAWESSPIIWFFMLVSAAITAVYMFRLLYLTFFGDFRGSADEMHHLHESPPSMTIPLIILAILSTFGGFLGMPESFGAPHMMNNFLSSVLSDLPVKTAESSAGMEGILMAISVAVALGAMVYAMRRYTIKIGGVVPPQKTRLVHMLRDKYYIDEIYEALFVKPIRWLGDIADRILDRGIIDGAVNGSGKFAVFTSRGIRLLQSGNIGFYIFAMVIGIVIILLINGLGFGF